MRKTEEEKAALREAKRLARVSQQHALAQEWRQERQYMEELRGRPLKFEELPLAQFRSFNQHVFMNALQAANDIIMNAPRTRDRLKAIEMVFDLRMDELKIRASLRGEVALTPEGDVIQPPPAPTAPITEGDAHRAVVLTEEMAEEYFANQRALLARGG